MNGPMIFLLYILPLSLAVTGLAIGFLYGRGGKDEHTHPGE